MTVFQICCFLELYAERNYTRVAQKLFSTQPYISRQIIALEHELGICLFQRNTHTVSPTKAAEHIYTDLASAWKHIENALHQASLFKEGISGELNIGIYHAMLMEKSMDERLLSFANLFPKIKIQYYNAHLPELEIGLQNNTYDVILTLEGIRLVSSMQSLFFSKIPLYFGINRTTHWFRSKQILSPEDFCDAPFVAIEDSENKYDLTLYFCRKLGIKPLSVTRVKNYIDKIIAVENGQGAALVEGTARILNNPQIALFPLPVQREGNIVAVWKQNNENPALRQFIYYLKNKKA